MEKEKLIEEILEIVHRVAEHDFDNWKYKKIDALVTIRNKILKFKGDDALGQITLYLNGFIEGLKH